MASCSLYKDEYIQILLDYFFVDPYKIVKDSKSGTGESKQAVDLPTFWGAGVKIGVYSSTLEKWAIVQDKEGNLKHPDWAEAYRRCQDKQREIFIVNGLHSLYSSQYGILVSANLFGWNSAKNINENIETRKKKPKKLTPEKAHEVLTEYLRSENSNKIK